MRRAALAAIAALVLLAAGVASAATITYKGAGDTDPAMPVKVRLGDGGVIDISYSDVLATCTNGDAIRYPGASHSTTVGPRGRFKDKIVDGEASSQVRGRVGERKASGTLRYDIVYDGGECHSGELEWTARRR